MPHPYLLLVGMLLKKFIDPSTLEKLVILGSDYQDVLRKVIPVTSLPKDYGGQLDWHLTGGGSLKEIAKKTKLIKLEITNTYTVTIKVKQDACVAWEFRTKTSEIHFGLYHHTEPNSEKEPIKDLKKEESHKYLIGDTYYTKKDGYLSFVWDNSSSWTRSKIIKYLIYLDGDPLDEKNIVSQTKK